MSGVTYIAGPNKELKMVNNFQRPPQNGVEFPVLTALTGKATESITSNQSCGLNKLKLEQFSSDFTVSVSTYCSKWATLGGINYFIVGMSATPYFAVYSYINDVFTKIADPTTKPNYTVYHCASIEYNSKLYIALSYNNYCRVYSFDGYALTVFYTTSVLSYTCDSCSLYEQGGYLYLQYSYYYNNVLVQLSSVGSVVRTEAFTTNNTYSYQGCWGEVGTDLFYIWGSSGAYVRVTKVTFDSITGYSTSYYPITSPTLSGSVNSCAAIADGSNVIISSTSSASPYLDIITFDGTTLTKVCNPYEISGIVSSSDWMDIEGQKYLAVTATNIPYDRIYLYNGRQLVPLNWDYPQISNNNCTWYTLGQDTILTFSGTTASLRVGHYKVTGTNIVFNSLKLKDNDYLGYCSSALAVGESGEFIALFSTTGEILEEGI